MMISVGLDIRHPEALKSVELPIILDKMKKSQVLKDMIEGIRKEENKDNRKALKAKLPYMVAGIFSGKRATEAFISSELFVFDVDHVNSFDFCFSQVVSLAHCHFAFRSPSGDGIKFGVRLSKPITSAETYTLAYRACAEKINKKIGVTLDKTCDAARACFLSFDENLYYCKRSQLWMPTVPEIPKPRPYTPNYQRTGDNDFDKAMELARNAYISDYHQWIEAGMALKSAFGDRGFDVFKVLSLGKGGGKDTEKTLWDKWRSFSEHAAVTLGTFILHAKNNGGKND